MLARMLLQLAADAGVDGDAAVDAGREQGGCWPPGRRRSRPCVDAAVAMLGELGFDPESVDDDDATTVAFTHCPFADLAEANPDLVCSLHRGMLEGFVDRSAGPRSPTSTTAPIVTPACVDLACRRRPTTARPVGWSTVRSSLD